MIYYICSDSNFLAHHGVKGMKWGVRRYQNYDGTRIKSGTVFVSGSSKTQTKDSPYYRKKLPKGVTDSLDKHMKKNDKIVVGDAPGIDRQVQDYLKSKKYKNVEVYGPGKQVRYSADDSWKTNPIDSDYEEGSKEWLAEKDKMMSQVATEGIAIVLPEGSKATRKNIDRLIEQNKKVDIFELNQNEKYDRSYTSDDYVLAKNRATSAAKTKPMVDEIISTMSKDEKEKLGLHESGKYLTYEDGASVAKRVLIKDGNTPVSFFDIFDDDDHYNLAIGTRSESEYRGKGYATKAAKRGMNYYEKHMEEFGNKPVIWGVRKDNKPSIKIAKSLGFELDESSYSDDDQWVNYVKKY